MDAGRNPAGHFRRTVFSVLSAGFSRLRMMRPFPVGFLSVRLAASIALFFWYRLR
ncbi:MAG TPA: hypothetical protein VNX25_09245 [Verrucomicrobiae bacterium]|nr:hypothetical protein [Verrucomicrobiae bacterium]